MEVKRGLLDVGLRHANIALGILHRTPNVWLEAAAENVRFAVSIISSDLEGAQTFGWANRNPKPGQVLLFPSWLHHYVNPFRGKGERISIAFNTTAEINPAA